MHHQLFFYLEKSAFQILLLLNYKALNGQAPSYLKELIVPYYPSRRLNSQNAGLLVVPRVSKSRMEAELSVIRLLCCEIIWKVLVWEVDTLSMFKKKLKTFLFDIAFTQGWLRLSSSHLLAMLL